MTPAFAHSVSASEGPAGWSFDPWIIAPLAATALIYLLGSRRLAKRSRTRRVGPAVLFWSGLACLALALVSPLHEAGVRVFTLHMVEHELIMVVAVPLMVAARPGAALLWGLPEGWRRDLAAATHGLLGRMWCVVTELWSATFLHAAVLWAWHAPTLFHAALENEGIHALQHISFILSAVFFWVAVLRCDALRRHQGAAILALFLSSLQAGALGALLTFSASPWYPFAPDPFPISGLTRGEDQVLAGLVMWVPACTLYIVAALILLARWMSALELRHASH